jgi:hypothetical protein
LDDLEYVRRIEDPIPENIVVPRGFEGTTALQLDEAMFAVFVQALYL